MPIELLTGLPGNGKTALMMERLEQEAEKGERPLFACGIDGLRPGLATVLDDPKRWNDLTNDRAPDCDCDKHPSPHAHVVPSGALIFVDECWKWFGHLHDATRQATPAHVLALAEHRHRGLDFVWTTQQPGQIYPFARGLIATHHHVVRRFGTQFIDVFTWQELCDDVKSASRRDGALKKTRTLPEKVFDSYKSAEVHTIKRRIPLRVIAIPALLAAAAVCAFLVVQMLKPKDANASAAQVQQAASADLSAPPPSVRRDREGKTYDSPEAYAQAHTPRIATIPGSAPIFDGRPVTADPQLFCMQAAAGEDASGHWRDESCTCHTEQGTPYALPSNVCRMLARQGAPYNPYKERERGMRGDGAAAPSSAASMPLGGASSSGVTISAEQVSGYGDIGVGSRNSAPR